MEDKQIRLLKQVLAKLSELGVLRHTVVVGSWCLFFYRLFYDNKSIGTLRTRDVDLMIPDPAAMTIDVDVPEEMQALGFVTDYRGDEGYMRLMHPEFFLEFLVPMHGRETKKVYPLRQMGANAQRLRYLDMLCGRTITVRIGEIEVMVPHPALFLLHKIIVYTRRSSPFHKDKDIIQIERLIALLEQEGELGSLPAFFSELIPAWQKTVIKNLKALGRTGLIDLLSE
ncbi:MAG: hypothetical protein GXY80_14025 [Syntrophorhabdus aromaticivorans]|jgi:hypothetical protein|uniref:Nucleotidyltransferase-like domain-containing protein n=1 Tax=Syntrophorhabdus aromaticivorans TaxID=328301 RepID=A0A971S1K1_9BACT|nr:hypothetical protein [Syntrophorhabdus aromaticivorans]